METAFQRILTEIYHIVSKKALASEEGPAAVSRQRADRQRGGQREAGRQWAGAGGQRTAGSWPRQAAAVGTSGKGGVWVEQQGGMP